MPDAAPDARSIWLNGQAHPWTSGLTLAGLLTQAGLRADQGASARNGEFVPRGQRAQTKLEPGDQITLFDAIAGG